MELLKALAAALERGDHQQTLEITRQAIKQEIPAKRILDDGLVAGMSVVGERFGAREIYLPDVLLAAKAMYAGLDQLEPLLEAGDMSAMG
ncbi:MAG: B12-binding domain-containing protein, partial [Candidatus Marinimicrobia bacterium]|nr:B12-binding domain-containing protein [Candidatus Neomarinimicrobiota bacterium]